MQTTLIGRRCYRLDAPVTGHGLTIPAGFVFQVSVPPWMTWPIDPHDERWLYAALFHDYALSLKLPKWRCSLIMARAMADAFPVWAWWWIPPAFLATLVVTVCGGAINRLTSWAKRFARNLNDMS